MADETEEGLGNVPSWVLRMVRDQASTLASVSSLQTDVTEIRQKVEGFVTRDEYDPRHQEVVNELKDLRDNQVKPLWDAHNQTIGELKAQSRSSIRYRWIFGTAIGLVGLWAVLHSGGITIHF